MLMYIDGGRTRTARQALCHAGTLTALPLSASQLQCQATGRKLKHDSALESYEKVAQPVQNYHGLEK